jgi:hypothetical protein
MVLYITTLYIEYYFNFQEKRMKTRKIWLGMFVIVFGVAIFSCKDDPDDGNDGNNVGGVDSTLNGTWVIEEAGASIEMKLNSGNCESSINGVPNSKGTYTTSSSKMTMTITHCYGFLYGLDSKWYTINEFIVALKDSDYPDDNPVSSPQTYTYTISGNSLTMTGTFGGETFTQTYTRKN